MFSFCHFFSSLIALGVIANLCVLYVSANKQVGRDFNLGAADEQKIVLRKRWSGNGSGETAGGK